MIVLEIKVENDSFFKQATNPAMLALAVLCTHTDIHIINFVLI